MDAVGPEPPDKWPTEDLSYKLAAEIAINCLVTGTFDALFIAQRDILVPLFTSDQVSQSELTRRQAEEVIIPRLCAFSDLP